MESLETLALLLAGSACTAGAAWAAARRWFCRTPFAYACDGYEMAIHGHHSDALRLYNRSIAEFRRSETTLPGYMERGGYARMGLAHAWRAITLARMGRAADALEDSERAGELGSSDRRVRLARAAVLHAAGMNGDLLEMADAQVADDPSDVNMHLYRAAALLGLGEPGPAVEALTKAHELAPASETLLRTRDRVERASRLRDVDRARYERYMREDSESIARFAEIDADWGPD